MIKLENVNLTINNKVILNQISVNIPDDCMTVIIGKSGSGKTMLMKTIVQLFRPQNGIISIDVDKMGPLKKIPLNLISMVFQNSALLDSFTVFQNIALPLYENSMYKEEEIIAKVHEILGFVGLDTICAMYPSELSGGMRKRVGIARALVTNPRYIILDEPTTGLDPITAKGIISFIKSVIIKRQLIPITITHDPLCINELGNYIVMMDAGSVFYSGKKESLMKCNDSKTQEFYISFFI